MLTEMQNANIKMKNFGVAIGDSTILNFDFLILHLVASIARSVMRAK